VIGSAVNVSSMDVTKTTDYVDGKIFENNVLDRIFVDGGYIKSGIYYFYETDHLGDNRTVINQSGTVVERNDYYPFGMQMAHNQMLNQASGSDNKRKFGGKELDVMSGLNLYDSQARWYDPCIPILPTVDPLCEKKPWISPYVYCSDNPVNRVDPDGRQDLVVPRVAPLPYWPADLKTGQAIVDLAKKVGTFVATALVIGTTQQVVTLNKTLNGNDHKEGKREQDKQDRKGKEKLDQQQANVEKEIDTNITGDMPDGNPAPKRNPNDGRKITKVALGVLTASGTVRMAMELTNPDPSKDAADAHLEQAQQRQQQPQNTQSNQSLWNRFMNWIKN
jgi:RHS repeat-associated protein